MGAATTNVEGNMYLFIYIICVDLASIAVLGLDCGSQKRQVDCRKCQQETSNCSKPYVRTDENFYSLLQPPLDADIIFEELIIFLTDIT
jgi:hypothetical protein